MVCRNTEPVQIKRIVFILEIRSLSDTIDILQSRKERCNGLPYGVLDYLHYKLGRQEKLPSHYQAQIMQKATVSAHKIVPYCGKREHIASKPKGRK